MTETRRLEYDATASLRECFSFSFLFFIPHKNVMRGIDCIRGARHWHSQWPSSGRAIKKIPLSALWKKKSFVLCEMDECARLDWVSLTINDYGLWSPAATTRILRIIIGRRRRARHCRGHMNEALVLFVLYIKQKFIFQSCFENLVKTRRHMADVFRFINSHDDA